MTTHFKPTSVFLPGESHGQRNLAGYMPLGCKDSDTTEVTQHACTYMSIIALNLMFYWDLPGFAFWFCFAFSGNWKLLQYQAYFSDILCSQILESLHILQIIFWIVERFLGVKKEERKSIYLQQVCFEWTKLVFHRFCCEEIICA